MAQRILAASEQRSTDLLIDMITRALESTVDVDSALARVSADVLHLNPEVQRALLIKAARNQLKRRVRQQQVRAVNRSVSEASGRMEWTPELLATEFGLSDGSHVTWGAATVEQHEQRSTMYGTQASAALRGAQRHRQAAIDIVQGRGGRGALNLYDAVDYDERQDGEI